MGATPTFVAVGTIVARTSGSGAVAVGIPADAQDGDHLVLAIALRGYVGSPVPSGWTAYESTEGDGAYFSSAFLCHKVCDSDDAGTNVTVPDSSSSGFLVVLVYRAARRNRPVEASAVADSNLSEVTSLEITGPTVVDANVRTVTLWCSTDDTAPEDQTVTPPATSRAADDTTALSIGFAVADDASAAATARTATTATSGRISAVSICLAGAGGQVSVI